MATAYSKGMRIINRRVFRLDDHLRRLAVSARAIGLNIPASRTALQELVLDTARAFGQDEAYIRLLVTRGDGELGVDPTRCEQPRIICIVDHIQLFPADKLEQGHRLDNRQSAPTRSRCLGSSREKFELSQQRAG